MKNSIEKYYSEGNEKDRLSEFRLEKERTLRILQKHLPKAPAVILDIGGAAGVYSFPLTNMGYEVHLIDPVELHIKQAQEYAQTAKCTLAGYSIGDARKLERKDNSADVVLMLGPLYHLLEEKDRLQALSEAYRVLKPGGLLFAAAISRFASFMDSIHKGKIYDKRKVIQHEFASGVHKKLEKDFDFLYLHYPKDLKREVEQSGFKNTSIVAIEGPVWEKTVIGSLQQDKQGWEEFLKLLEIIEEEESIIGASDHIMAIAYK